MPASRTTAPNDYAHQIGRFMLGSVAHRVAHHAPCPVTIDVLNDLVTITLGTDRAWVSPVPERWNVREIAKLSGILAAGWLALAFSILWVGLNVLKLPIPQIQTLMFVYLIYSAQATIYMTRVRDHFWSFAPSRFVVAVTVGDVVGVRPRLRGILMAAVPAVCLIGTLGAVFAAAFLLDEVKIWIYQNTGILGRSSQTPRRSE